MEITKRFLIVLEYLLKNGRNAEALNLVRLFQKNLEEDP